MRLERQEKNKLIIYILTALFVFLIFKYEITLTVFFRVLSIITPFLIGLAIAFIINQPLHFLEKKLFVKIAKTKKQYDILYISGIVISYVLTFVIFFILLNLIIPQLVESFKSLEKKIPEFLNLLNENLKQYPKLDALRENYEQKFQRLNWAYVFNTIKDYILEGPKNAYSAATNVVSAVLGSFLNIVLGLVFSIYVLLSRRKLKVQTKRLIYSICNKERADWFIHVGRVSYDAFSGFIQGQITDATILAIICYLGMLVMKMPYAPMISVLVGVTDLVPIVGPFFGAGIGALLIFIENPMQALVFIIFMVIIQQIEGNIIYPLVVGNKVGIPSMWMLVAITIGASLMGILGMILFVPLASVIYVLVGEFTEKRLRKKGVMVEDSTF